VQHSDLKGYFMKFTTALIFSISLIISSHSNATLLTAVGGVDEFITSEDLGKSGANTELDWVIKMLVEKGYESQGTSFEMEKYEYPDDRTNTDYQWSLVEDDIYSTAFDNSPVYFLLKFGMGSTGITDTHFLFKNVGDLKFAVIDLSVAGLVSTSKKDFSIERISHIGQINAQPTEPNGGGTGTSIPEPMTISLFAIALLSLTRRSYRR
jgi:hypothetical protein